MPRLPALHLVIVLSCYACAFEEESLGEEDDSSTWRDVDVAALPLVEKRTIYGFVRDTAGKAVQGVRVQAFDDDDPAADSSMGVTYTDATGFYEIHYAGGHWDPCPHEITCWRPDIYVAVSVRRWKLELELPYTFYTGPEWDGALPLCRSFKYGWQRVANSREFSDWRLDTPLRVDLVMAPKQDVWDDESDRPECVTGDSFCYSFSALHNSCFAEIPKQLACADGWEYSLPTSLCVGFWDYYSVNPFSRCYGVPLQWLGECKPGGSLPPLEGNGEPTPCAPGIPAHTAGCP